jgi:hypothetical protein
MQRMSTIPTAIVPNRFKWKAASAMQARTAPVVPTRVRLRMLKTDVLPHEGQRYGDHREYAKKRSGLAIFWQCGHLVICLSSERQPSPDGAPCAPYGARHCCAFYRQYAGMVLDSNSVPV